MFDIKVSIIMPSYNSEHYISKTIDSILSQTVQDWELIIIDDCSSDNSNKVINSYISKCSQIKLIQLEKNMGPAFSRNRGIKEAQGRYIAFLDSDDVWMKHKLEKQLAFMQEKNAAISFTAYNLIDEKQNLLKIGVFEIPLKVNYSQLLKNNVIGCSTVIYDTNKLKKILFPEIKKRQDYALWLLILRKVDYAYGLNEPLTDYTLRENSVSSNRFIAAYYTWKVYKDVEKLSLFKSCYYLSNHLLKGVKKYWLKG